MHIRLSQISVLFFFVLTALFFVSQPVFADLINPEWFNSKCNLDEKEIVCSYSSVEPFGPRTQDECIKYKNKPEFRFLTGHGSSFGGEEKYCYRNLSLATSIELFITQLAQKLLVTLLLELLVLIFFRYKVRELIIYTLANIISLMLFHGMMTYITFLPWVVVIVGEALVIFFEYSILKNFTKRSSREILKVVLIANIVSATLGTLLVIMPFQTILLRLIYGIN